MTNARYWEYLFLVQRDGEHCKSCKKTGIELVIAHIDGNRQNNNPLNKALYCRSCNRKDFIAQHYTNSVREKTNARILDEGAVERESPELRISKEKEPEYFAWLFENVERKNGLTFFDAVYEGADRVGISPVTARRYLYKKLATELRLGDGSRGHKRILYREPSDKA